MINIEIIRMCEVTLQDKNVLRAQELWEIDRVILLVSVLYLILIHVTRLAQLLMKIQQKQKSLLDINNPPVILLEHLLGLDHV